ncbi:MAG: 50S ribosomal protein L10 [Candidatus Aenigmarchaeota archaeon]|nr:50S ribosomal protein L10 [Candidatus Aenigmarchaeota archaeon]
MASQRKLNTVKEVREMVSQYPVIGVLNMHKLPGKQLHDMRNKLRGEVMIRVVKKRLITRIFEGGNGMASLGKYITGEPALLMTRMNPFRLARLLSESKSTAAAKPGDIAPREIIVRAGPTPFPPGPIIGEFQRAKIPAKVDGDKISIKEDTVVAKEGQVIEKPLADMLAKLGIEPIEIGLNLVAVYDNGTIYTRDVLFIPQEKYLSDLRQGANSAFNLTLNMGYYTRENIRLFLGRAYREAMAVAMESGMITKETIGPLLAKGHNAAQYLKGKVKIEGS